MELQVTPSSKWVFLVFFIQIKNLGKSPKALETTWVPSPATPVTWEGLTLTKRGLERQKAAIHVWASVSQRTGQKATPKMDGSL